MLKNVGLMNNCCKPNMGTRSPEKLGAQKSTSDGEDEGGCKHFKTYDSFYYFITCFCIKSDFFAAKVIFKILIGFCSKSDIKYPYWFLHQK